MGCRPRARSGLHCHGVLALRDRPLTWSFAGSAGRRANGRSETRFKAVQRATFGSMGCRPRARSALHCHGVLALRERPLTWSFAGSTGRRANGRSETRFKAVQRATFGSMGCWPRARSVLHCHGVLALRERPLSGALLAVQEGGRMEGLRLVSRQFRKQRLAVWAAGRGPDPYFTAMVFWLCETGL